MIWAVNNASLTIRKQPGPNWASSINYHTAEGPSRAESKSHVSRLGFRIKNQGLVSSRFSRCCDLCSGASLLSSFAASMADKAVTIRTRKFMTNRLLSRKQFVSLSFPKSPPFFYKNNVEFILITFSRLVL